MVRNLETVGEKIKHLAFADDRSGHLTWKVMSAFMYSAQRLGEIADTIVDIDNGLKWGFGWEMGPFETWDAMGVAQTVERMDADGTPVPTWVKDMLANGRQSFYDFNEAGAQTFWDPNTQSAVAIDEGEGETS